MARRISKSPLPGLTGHWPPLRARSSSYCPPLPEAPNNFGVSISLRTAVGASCLKGQDIVRAAIVNGGGATDFCARFLDVEDKPLKEITASICESRRAPLH